MQKNILLVDDESSLRRSLSLGLNQEGYSVEPCENGVTAIKKLDLYKKNSIDLDTVVLDIRLPDIDGIKLGEIIKQQYPSTNIIFITGYSDKVNSEDIRNLGGSTMLLEKPFTVKDLASRIEEFKKAATTEVPKKEAKPVINTFSAYILLKIRKDADFFSTFRELYFLNNVLYCDATKGEYDVFMLIQSNTMEGCREFCEKNIKTMKEIDEYEFMEVTNPVLDDSLRSILNKLYIDSSNMPIRESRNAVCSYLSIEIEKEKLDIIYPALYLNDNVVYCDYIDKKYRLILLVHGTQFTEIDNIIKNKIAPMDGVLRVKEYPIITIFEM